MAERPALSALKLSEEQLNQDIKGAFQHWHAPRRSYGLLEQLLLVRHAQLDRAEPAHRVINDLLLANLEAFDGEQANWAVALRMRYPDGQSVRDVARHFNVEDGTIQKWQQSGWKELASILYTQEKTLRAQTHTVMMARLERFTQTTLVGIDGQLETLTDLLLDPDGPKIVAIEGGGGMGKTTLADALLRRLISADIVGSGAYLGCAWVTARRLTFTVGGSIHEESTPALTANSLIDGLMAQFYTDSERPIGLTEEQSHAIVKRRLTEQPHIVVVDNLETLEDIDALLDTLRELVGKTRIVLTTRHNLFSEPDVYHIPIKPLSQTMALDLVRSEAKQRNLSYLAKASDEDLIPIYQTVGGNPLALRLVVGQTHIHALGDVLADLLVARGEPIENLYTHIYWQAWSRLDEPAREAWLLMPLVNGQGMTLPHLAEIAEMDAGDLRNALDQLVTLNLIDRRGGLTDSRYTIHPLTRSFLQNQVLQWGEKVAGR